MKFAAALDRHMKWILFAPAVIVMVAIFVYPVVYAVNLSMHDWHMFTMSDPPFVLFQNYATAFKDRELWAALTKTAIFVAGGLALQFVIGMLLAMGVDRLTR
jgi:multiple sugar transport system permease protein